MRGYLEGANMNRKSVGAVSNGYESAMLQSVGGDKDFLSELIGLFLAAYPKLLSQLEKAVAGHDVPEIARVARILKGAGHNFAAEDVRNAAMFLKEAAHQNNPAFTMEAFQELKKTLKRLTSALVLIDRRQRREAALRWSLESEPQDCAPSHDA
jgi:HPt (histidine-containing phosphotransfer) domain-containing protein